MDELSRDPPNGGLNLLSLREQVYRHLRSALHRGELEPGSNLDLGRISAQLGISKTPLRDALIRLEAEGFVTILPRRGVQVRAMTLEDVRDAYQTVGALEAAVVLDVFDRLDEERLERMEELNRVLVDKATRSAFDNYYRTNLEFHEVFLELSPNRLLRRLIMPLKQRLYDFPRRDYLVEWELRNCDEHRRFIDLVRAGDRRGAADFMRDVHWSFEVQGEFIRRFEGVG